MIIRRRISLFIILLLALDLLFSYEVSKFNLNELYSTMGKFIIINDKIITIDNKDFTIKIFSMRGKLLHKKIIKGNGPGEVSTLGTFVFPDGNNIFILESQKRKWLIYDKKLSFVKEGKLNEPVSIIKKTRTGYIAGEASFTEKYFKKIFVYAKYFSIKRKIYTEYGKVFGKKIDTEELYLTLDSKQNKIVVAGGDKRIVSILNLSGKLIDKINLTNKIEPSKYNNKELSMISKNIPNEVKMIMEFKNYPAIISLLFISDNKLLIISGEKDKNGKFKSFIYDFKTKRVKQIESVPEGGTYIYNNKVLYIMNEGEEKPYVLKIKIKEII